MACRRGRGEVQVSMDLVNLADYERAAREKLPQMAYDYYASGACDEITLAENIEAYRRIKLLNRVLVDVERRDLSTTVLGQPVEMPILIPPMAFQRMAHDEGELATARAAGSLGTIMTLSTFSNCSLERVAAVATAPLWFQLYVHRDRAVTESLVKRAEQAGYSALVVTVDAPFLAGRERDARNRFRLPPGLTAENLMVAEGRDLSEQVDSSALVAYFAARLDPALTWKDIEWLRSLTGLPVVLKGIMRADDALAALQCGASAIVVSNHGGRQLDSVPATIAVLPEIVEAVDGRLEVLLDGGVRRGTDVVKALALGARAVLCGRPVLWGLAVAGEQGVRDVLSLLRAELDCAMALCGCNSVGGIDRGVLWRPADSGGKS